MQNITIRGDTTNSRRSQINERNTAYYALVLSEQIVHINRFAIYSRNHLKLKHMYNYALSYHVSIPIL